jgi:hypothetical protein
VEKLRDFIPLNRWKESMERLEKTEECGKHGKDTDNN